MRILGHVCTFNEGDRYLNAAITWHQSICDAVHVFDDRSTDDTVGLARATGAFVDVRDENDTPFLKHEGEFRHAGWRAFEQALAPGTGDWVLAFDADEFVVSANGRDERTVLEQLINMARIDQVGSWKLRVDEIFDAPGGRRRVDGFWGDISAVRFVQYRGLGHFANRKMGCGSVPTYGVQEPGDARKFPLSILHYGYAEVADRARKHALYTSVLNNGHNSNHVKSIVTTPTLEPLPHTRRPTL